MTLYLDLRVHFVVSTVQDFNLRHISDEELVRTWIHIYLCNCYQGKAMGKMLCINLLSLFHHKLTYDSVKLCKDVHIYVCA